jgi:hypothetical protein
VTALPTFNAGTEPTAAQWQTLLPIVARKTSDQTVNNSNTLVNDTQLFISVAASAVYRVEMHVVWNSNSTADWSWAFSAPSGAQGWYTNLAPPAAGTIPYTGALGWTNPVGASEGQGADVYSRFSGNLITTSSGTLQFKWAQNTANASNTIVRLASMLVAWQVG